MEAAPRNCSSKRTNTLPEVCRGPPPLSGPDREGEPAALLLQLLELCDKSGREQVGAGRDDLSELMNEGPRSCRTRRDCSLNAPLGGRVAAVVRQRPRPALERCGWRSHRSRDGIGRWKFRADDRYRGTRVNMIGEGWGTPALGTPSPAKSRHSGNTQLAPQVLWTRPPGEKPSSCCNDRGNPA